MGKPPFDLLRKRGWRGLMAVLLAISPLIGKAEHAALSSIAEWWPAIRKAIDAHAMARLNKAVRNTAAPDDLLRACWTPAELRGSAGDRSIQKQASDPSPPERISYQKQALLPEKLGGSIRYVKPRNAEKWVALTFDLCEQAHEKSGYDADLVNYLRDHQVKATFFAGGKWMRSHPVKTMQLMADPLFEIGNHAWTHGNLRVLNGPGMYDQITWTQAEYEILREKLLQSKCAARFGEKAAAAIPPALTTFRFPYGACNAQSLAAVNQTGLVAIQWNIVTGDPVRGQTAQNIARTVLNQVQPGSIVVAHANGRGWHTAEALPLIISGLRKQGYRFVTISELLATGEVFAAESCYELKPGDNLRYDRLFKAGAP
ncbi:MAG TPA: polysaccharide deacetylase family protein [Candidatus Competibacteraceae bacterium]|nr:polysaccharide deacetylase family protein [Candidatus Competibacteraceae bacterium]